MSLGVDRHSNVLVAPLPPTMFVRRCAAYGRRRPHGASPLGQSPRGVPGCVRSFSRLARLFFWWKIIDMQIAPNDTPNHEGRRPGRRLSVRVSRLLEYGGSALGMAGSLWMSLGTASSSFAWWVWLFSNVLLVAWAVRVRAGGIVAMQSFYLVTSIIGILRH